MKHELALAADLQLPADAVTQKFAFLAQSGAGKTYGAMKLAELMLAAGAQIVSLDPVGVWWALRAGADGKSAGFSVVVFGGDHGDVPLTPESGELVARLVVEERISAVLDLSGFTTAETKRFVTAFAEAFFQAKKRHKSPVHVFLEEAQTFAPQVPERDEGVMLNRIERLLKLGRNYGVGWTLISQQPQAVHKRCLNQAGCLVALRTLGKHERKAISEWVSDKATSQSELDLLGELPSLATGEAFVWSPAWLRLTKRIRIAKRTTFDASATPAFGEHQEQPRKLAPVDIEQIRGRIGELVQRAEQDDPKVLRKQVQQLQTELAKVRAAVPPPPKAERVEVPVLTQADRELLDQQLGTVRKELSSAAEWLAVVEKTVEVLIRRVPIPPVSRVMGVTRADAAAVTRSAASNVHREHPPALLRRASVAPQGDVDRDLPRGAREMLSALASTLLPSLSRAQVALLAGLKVTGGTYAKYLSVLKTGGYVETRGDQLAITDAGLDAIGGRPEVPTTTEGIIAMWNEKLPAGARQMLDVLVREYPNSIARADLAAATGIEASGGTFAKYLSLLRTSGLVETIGGQLAASQTLFPSAAMAALQ